MRWTCPKCGKKLEISNEQLIAGDGVIVCPQCLLQARQPLPKTKGSTSTPAETRTTTSNAENDTVPPYRRTTPPPHKTRMKQASTSYRYTGVTGTGNSNNTTTRKKTTPRRKAKKKKQEGISALGCLGRTIVFTLILFAAYVFFGLLLEAMQ